MRRLVETVVESVLERPRSVLVGALLLTLAAAWLGTGIELRTSRRELSADDDPAQLRWDAVAAELGEPEPLIVVLEAPGRPVDTELLERTAADLAARLTELPEVDSVLYRVDADWLLRSAPWLVPRERLAALVGQAGALLADGDGVPVLAGLAPLNERLAARIEEAVARGDALPTRQDADAAGRLAQLLAAERAFFEDPEGAAGRLESMAPLAAMEGGPSVTDAGTLSTRAGDALFLLVRRAVDGGSLAEDRRLVEAVRTAAAEVVGGQLRLGLTGRPAMSVEEMDTIARDGRTSSLVAILGVTLLALGAFHHRRHALVGLAVLVTGVVWALGAVKLELGYLNMITTSLVPILVGVGIDYAVHPISQFEIERRPGRALSEALTAAFARTGPAVAVSALTTAAAFACFLFMEFRGFAELGLVAGVGVLLCLLAALVVLPAALLLAARPATGEAEPPALIDRVWGRRQAAALCRRPGATVAVAGIVTVAALAAGAGVRVDTSLVELMPPGAESLHYLDRVAEDSELGAWFNLVVADDLESLRQLRAAAAEMPEIARVDEPSRLLPGDPGPSREAVAALAGFLRRLRIETPGDSSPQRLHASLERLEAALAGAADTAFLAGLGATAGALERARGEAEAALAAARDADPDTWRPAEAGILDTLRRARDELLEAAVAGPPSLAEVPGAIRSRFVTGEGRFVAYLYPSGDVFDPEFLRRFNAASRSLHPDAVGFPVLFEIQSARITGGFRLAFAVGALVVLLLLAADLRRPGDVLLALVPVLVGVAWMLGTMRMAGLSFNLANLVAVPLVLGVGIDAGVHMLHRYRLHSGALELVVEQTGRALLIASLTTMVGFGALGLAHHRGMASLGILLLLGVGACLVAALVVLPNVLRLLERRRP